MTVESEIPHSEIHEQFPWVIGHQRLEAQLVLEGFRIDFFGGMCPFQAGGWLPTGEYFYFRGRGECVSLEVWQKNFEPREPHMGWCPDAPADFHVLKRAFDWPDAGYLLHHEVNKHLRRFLRAYREWKKKPSPLPRLPRGWSMKKHERMMRRWRKRDEMSKRRRDQNG